MRYSDLLEAPDIETLARIVDIVGQWVSHGPVEDAEMDFVWQNWPRPKNGMRLWRVQVLTKPQAARLAGKGLRIPVHRYLSWTSDFKAVERLAFARTRGGVPVIVEQEFPASAICVAVHELLHHVNDNNLDYIDTLELERYGGESEVIVRHDAPLRLTRENTRVFAAKQDVPAPKVGERAFHADGEDAYLIKRVIEQNEDGSWRVDIDYVGEEDVRYVAPNEWEIVERYG